MKRETFVHFAFWIAFFVFIAVVKNFFTFSAWTFWLGGLVGIFLPDLDHLIYVIFLKPHELTSQRVSAHLGKSEYTKAVKLLYATRNERRGLTFHTIIFQVIFMILTFWILTSSASLFGRALALSFALHLNVDQLIDYLEGSFDNWFSLGGIKFNMENSKRFVTLALVVTLVLGFMM